jgi:hypothetical protein
MNDLNELGRENLGIPLQSFTSTTPKPGWTERAGGERRMASSCKRKLLLNCLQLYHLNPRWPRIKQQLDNTASKSATAPLVFKAASE